MKLKIMGKLMLAFGMVLLLTLGICLYLVFEIKMTANNYSALICRKAYSYAWIEAAANLRGFVITGNPEHDNRYRQAVTDGNTYMEKVASQVMNKKEKDEVASTSQNLTRMAEELEALAERFKLA